jgi:peptidoglycan hydrolase-like protein with peptidoglycan-binding domain
MAMARSARQPEIERSWTAPLAQGAAALSGMIGRNPVLVGGSTAFLVALAFVSANALWYQPHAHSGAFFATRDFPGQWESETTINIERPVRPIPMAKRDPKTEQAQAALKELGLYGGEVDGIFGPNTRTAIELYQTKMGLAVTGQPDDRLLDDLGSVSTTAGIVPTPAPRPELAPKTQPEFPGAAVPGDQSLIRIQAGLRAFGNEAVEIDGVLGARTKSAILEFQSLFGLPQTGEPDGAVLAKMQQIGLTN